MRKLASLALVGVATLASAACVHGNRLQGASVARTVLEVDNQGFPDMNIYVVPEGASRIRLGTVTGTSKAYFTLPATVVTGIRELRFQALPIATPRGEISESILVTPGDTVTLVIPPS